MPRGHDQSRPPAGSTEGAFRRIRRKVTQINLPLTIIIGDRDPVKRLYVAPLQQVRSDWPVVEIGGAGHVNCIIKPQFREEIARWVRAHESS